MYFDFDLFEYKDIFDQCVIKIDEISSDVRLLRRDKKANFTDFQTQIMNHYMFKTSKYLDDNIYDLFKVLAFDILYNCSSLKEGIELINKKFEKNGDWFAFLNGSEKLNINTSFV